MVSAPASRRQLRTRDRLASAAMRLFAEQGYDNTTVAQIADGADLSARSFFRYFADKDAVLFSGETALLDAVARVVEDHADDLGSLMHDALNAAADALDLDRDGFVVRHRVIAASDRLRGREQVIQLDMQAALSAGLVAAGVDRNEASLTARMTMALWNEACERWVTSGMRLGDHLDAVLAEFRNL
ncbi:Transcriptional regulator, TetR family [Rhodococcus sp. AW25M09]|uniref:TetR/AcrR family transcriptional regulator n=1 Tax=Rhodococcus sp. AW25M09 TaxID=1268303 RepID=UPI0002AC9A57|nr:TetR/AcrR family transcriptional regulator [Rhodococcus sp. AW25M09]CCQ13473.1 Transcriptional regulator, TetR family [Rhodococcus sp. AW25M09]